MTDRQHVFSGLKVLDLASYIAGPAATTILADFGADVIKIEPPGTGDVYRFFSAMPPNPVAGTNYAWQLTNRNKRSIALDLKSSEAKEVLVRLVQWADVVVVNFPPRVKAALGVTYEALSPLNPKLIYADITGYGSEGPEADTPGFDVTAYWARSGLMEVTHDAGNPPTLPIPGIGDHATATTLYAAIVTALYTRATTGKGGHVSTSLIANGIWAAAAWVEGGLNGGRFFASTTGKIHPTHCSTLTRQPTVDGFCWSRPNARTGPPSPALSVCRSFWKIHGLLMTNVSITQPPWSRFSIRCSPAGRSPSGNKCSTGRA